MCFDVSKIVRSPGYDHGHDEESRNGRDIKIDILEAYVWTSEWFGVSSGIYRSTGTPQGVYGPYWALVGERRRRPRWGHPPSPIRIGVGAGPPFLLPLFSFHPLLLQLGKGGILLPVGVGLPLGMP